MAHDLFFNPNSRNWSRGQAAPPQTAAPAAAMAGSGPLKKLALGTMALGTAAGLIFITSPWWKPLPRQPVRDPMRRRIYLPPNTPSTRVLWSRR